MDSTAHRGVWIHTPQSRTLRDDRKLSLVLEIVVMIQCIMRVNTSSASCHQTFEGVLSQIWRGWNKSLDEYVGKIRMYQNCVNGFPPLAIPPKNIYKTFGRRKTNSYGQEILE